MKRLKRGTKVRAYNCPAEVVCYKDGMVEVLYSDGDLGLVPREDLVEEQK